MALRGGKVASPSTRKKRRDYLLDLLKSNYTEVGIQKIDSQNYILFQKIAESTFWMAKLTPNNEGLPSIHRHSFGKIFFSQDDTYSPATYDINETEPEVVRVGSWSSGSIAAAWGGDYRYSTTAGNTVSITPDEECTVMGIHCFRAVNGGVARAEIDGDTSKCNMLPTAQELVDSGAISALALAGSGLSGTDRVVLFYRSATASVDVPVAIGLAPGIHTLKLTVTNIVPNGANSNRTYDAGYYYSASTGGSATYHVGAGWTGTQIQPLAYGGSYRNTTTAGDKVLIQALGNVTGVGLRAVRASNGGIARVSIDGSFTAANKCPTGQELVDSGQMSALYLTTSGGPIAPTDRCINFYLNGTNYDVGIEIADGLAPGPHTIEIICTTARNVGASSNRLYSSGFMYAVTGINLSTPGINIVSVRDLLDENSEAEYAYDITYSGAGAHGYVGNGHQYDSPISIVVKVDGVVENLVDGEVASGTKIEMIRTSRLHPLDSPSVDACEIVLTYTVTQDGLFVEHIDTWLTAVTAFNCYVAMFPLTESTINKASLLEDNADYTMNPINSGDIYYGDMKSELAYMWEEAGDVLGIMWAANMPESVNNWQNTDKYMRMQDRAGDRFVKAYLHRTGHSAGTTPVAAGEVWRTKTLYRLGMVPNVNSKVAR